MKEYRRAFEGACVFALLVLFLGACANPMSPNPDRINPKGSTAGQISRSALAPSGSESNFTIVVLPDTQNYVSYYNGGYPEEFYAQTSWITANREAQNIAYVAHLGDISNAGDSYESEWVYASNAMYPLETPTAGLPDGIPYGVALGNHDLSPMGSLAGTSRLFEKYFGVTHFSNHSYYGGHYGRNNRNHYDLFSVNGVGYIVVYLEWDPEAAAISWANGVLNTYSYRKAIVVSHWILGGDAPNNNSFGTAGQHIYDGLKANPNLFLTLCGHWSRGHRVDVYNGSAVTSLMGDYQGYADGGHSYMWLMNFDPFANSVSVTTYAPYFNEWRTAPEDQFTMTLQPYATTAIVGSGDFNGDGIVDLIARRSDGTLWLYPGDGAGGFMTPYVQIGSGGWNQMTALVTPGDWDGDGFADILARDASGVLWLYPGDGLGGLLPERQISSGWNAMTSIVAAGDFSGDGKADLIVRKTDGSLSLYKGNGSGGFITPYVKLGTGWNGMTAIVGAGDWNGDRRNDVIARDGSGALWLYPGNGKNGFQTRVQIGTAWDAMSAILVPGDWNGDGKSDVLARDTSGNLWIYPGDGTGGFLTPNEQIGTGW